MSQNPPQPIFLKDYQPPAFLIDTVDLRFNLDPSATEVTATSLFRRNPASTAPAEPLTLNGEELILKKITLDNRELPQDRWTEFEGGITIHDPPDAFSLTTVTEIDPKSNKALEGLYISSERFCTQCEAEGFRKITYYLDRPDVLAKFKVTLIADKARYPTLLSNGNLTDHGNIDDQTHYAVWEDPFPKPCYLFALVAGDLGCLSGDFQTASGRNVALHIYVEHGKVPRAAYALDALKRSMRWDEVIYGLEYDLDIFNIVAVSDFNMGAMENKSLNIFNDKFILADPETATDTDYAWIESVVAHEYFHNWTGNRVTCRDWFQLSLKEGLTVFRDQQFSADQRSSAVQRIDDVKRLRAAQFTEDASPLAHPVRPNSYAEINNFYTHTVYEKGAEVVRMIHSLIGADAFRKGMDLYFERHDGQAVTCEDFIDAMESASGCDMTQFMLWYRQAGTPRVHTQGTYYPDEKKYVLELSQSCKPTPGQDHKKSMHIPVAIGFVDAQQGSLKVSHRVSTDEMPALHETHIVSLTEHVETLVFEDFPEGVQTPVASINRGFSAPVIVKSERSETELKILIASDPDPLSRWDAAQELALDILVKRLKGESRGTSISAYLDSIGSVLDSADEDHGLTAQILGLPVESAIAESFETFDPIAVYETRQWLKRLIGDAFCETFLKLYHETSCVGPYDPSGADANKRSLRHQALTYLVASHPGKYENIAFQQYANCKTMTERWSALQALNEHPGTSRQTALDDFATTFKDDSLVIDKWFALEASHPSADTLSRVIELMSHPKYDEKNPNKIRALIASFSMNNTVGFHQKSGEGYKFVADQIIEIDTFNPQSAARLAGVFQHWARYDQTRKSMMHAELSRIATTASLSQDVSEIVGKALAVSTI